MGNEKLTTKKILAIIGLTAIGTVGFGFLYLGIFVFSLPFTANATVSWILSLSTTISIILGFGVYTLKKKKRGNQN